MDKVIFGIFALVIATLISAIFGTSIIKALKKASFGQEIREEGPSWHKKKSGTPTMGAFIFFVGIIPSIFLIAILSKTFDFIGLSVIIGAFLFSGIGFFDDYIKVINKRNLGLTAGKKFLSQALLSLAMAIILYILRGGKTYIGPLLIDLNYFVIPFNVVVMLATVNAVNLTDGLDGLAGTTSTVSMLFFAFAAYTLGYDMLFVVMAAVIGGVIGFLVFNFYPAKVFMGDTGSLFLGGLIALASCAMGLQLTILLTGLIFFIETLSVILQVAYFKKTGGKRLFLMTPIHHHYEKKGWSEVKIVTVFSSITVITSLLCGIYVYYL